MSPQKNWAASSTQANCTATSRHDDDVNDGPTYARNRNVGGRSSVISDWTYARTPAASWRSMPWRWEEKSSRLILPMRLLWCSMLTCAVTMTHGVGFICFKRYRPRILDGSWCRWLLSSLHLVINSDEEHRGEPSAHPNYLLYSRVGRKLPLLLWNLYWRARIPTTRHIPAETSGWILHAQGGGWCWNEEECESCLALLVTSGGIFNN